MRYEEARRPRGIESVWLRFKLWFQATPRLRGPSAGDLHTLTDRDRRDIGAPEPVRYMDWHSLKDDGWR